MTDCVAFIVDYGPCQFPATHHAIFGCVHEHFREGGVCTGHMEISDLAECRACHESSTSHVCKLSLITLEALS